MIKTYCGVDCCSECPRLLECGGCEKCGGRPFGGSCVAARNRDFLLLKKQLIEEINAIGIEGLSVSDLNLLSGAYVNLAYPLANGSSVRFLKEEDVYFGNQVEREGSERCYGIVADETFLLICEYGCNGADPEIVLYKKRRTEQDPEELYELQDTEWPFEYTDHDRNIARAIVYDDDGYFYFVRAERDDDFGKATLIETSGGGVEAGEDLHAAIKRELKEELGAEVEVICKIGVVSDYYNLIHRHNLNNYFLCKVISFGDKHLTQDEIEDFHLSTLKVTYEEAVAEYEKRRETRLGRLIANRELPILRKARTLI
jgi:8-oxo-dGTP pyrophosphatase MutT (NUDIX family)